MNKNISSAVIDRLLGKMTRVRALRILIRADKPLSGAQIAVTAGLARPQIYRALKEFESMGLARCEVIPPAHAWDFVRDHPWARRLADLFEMEASMEAGKWETDRSKLERNLSLSPEARLRILQDLQDTARRFRKAHVVREYY